MGRRGAGDAQGIGRFSSVRRAAICWLAVAFAACGSSGSTHGSSGGQLPLLPAPAPIDPGRPGAAFLIQLASQFQRGWSQFLNDCRLRLPPTHTLNHMQLAAVVDIAIDRAGRAHVELKIPSGNAEFDRAVRDAIADAGPFFTPPTDILSDDDRAHVRWLFARDRRQAGARTAELRYIRLPIAGVVTRYIEAGEFSRAARRIAAEPPGSEREAATHRMMLATLQDALRSTEAAVQLAAVRAVAQARVAELAADVRGQLTVAADPAVRIAALDAAGEIRDQEAVATILDQLPKDLVTSPDLSRAATRALVRLDKFDAVALAIRRELANHRPSPFALDALAHVPPHRLDVALDAWVQSSDPRFRASACRAMPGVPIAQAEKRIGPGLADRDATVRAACAAAAARVAMVSLHGKRSLTLRIRSLVRDSDQAVRASAIEALGSMEPSLMTDVSSDPAAVVRAAYASLRSAPDGALLILIDDRDPGVRAAAWTTLSERTAFPERGTLAAVALADPAAHVRLAALPSVESPDTLRRLAASDDSPELRTAAIVELARRVGRLRVADIALERFATASGIGAEHVGLALAWLIAR